MLSSLTLPVSQEVAGMRLDAFLLQRVPTTSRALILEAISAGLVVVNGRKSLKGYKLEIGDEVTVSNLMETRDWKPEPNPDLHIPVLLEETDVLVIDKPSGIAVHPLHPSETQTVISALLARFPELTGIGPDPLFPAIVHRLDTETSGAMIVARTPAAYDYLRNEFSSRRVSKHYAALVKGRLKEPGRMEQYLAHSNREEHKMVVVKNAEATGNNRPMRAVTEYSVRRSFQKYTLLDVMIHTGVTHQIRCQLASAGHPLAGDHLYGQKGTTGAYKGRLFLHSSEITFRHPTTHKRISVRAPLPQDLEMALAGQEASIPVSSLVTV